MGCGPFFPEKPKEPVVLLTRVLPPGMAVRGTLLDGTPYLAVAYEPPPPPRKPWWRRALGKFFA